MFFFISPNSFYHTILLSILNRFRRQLPCTSRISPTLLSYSLTPLNVRYPFDSR
ncbi:hypothetical protein [Staphylococcus phage vB_SauM-V1SA19]|nr:hypothetical protein [Staphylococcus phage vB_SauM-V1SA19]